jgi:hypothetical protein
MAVLKSFVLASLLFGCLFAATPIQVDAAGRALLQYDSSGIDDADRAVDAMPKDAVFDESMHSSNLDAGRKLLGLVKCECAGLKWYQSCCRHGYWCSHKYDKNGKVVDRSCKCRAPLVPDQVGCTLR